MKLNTPPQEGKSGGEGAEPSNLGAGPINKGVELVNQGEKPSNQGAEPVSREAHLKQFLSWMSEDHRRRRSQDALQEEEVKEEEEPDGEGSTEEEELPGRGSAPQEAEGAGLLSDWPAESPVRGGKGSPLSERLRRAMVEQFQNGVPQRRIAKNLRIPPSSVHNIIQRFRQAGSVAPRRGQGRKPILNGQDAAALRNHRLKHRLQSMEEVTAWAQNTFRKQISVNTVRRCISKY